MTSDILRKVKAPAIGLIVVGSLNIIWAIISIIYNLSVGLENQANLYPNDQKGFYYAGLIIGFGILFIDLIIAPVIIYGAIQMMKGRKYGLSKAAAILAVIPFTSCCFLLGIPFGIWAIVVLSKPEVKAYFNGEIMSEPFNPPPPPQNW